MKVFVQPLLVKLEGEGFFEAGDSIVIKLKFFDSVFKACEVGCCQQQSPRECEFDVKGVLLCPMNLS